MYSAKLEKLLKSIREGEEIRVFSKGDSYEGILMPQSDLGDPDCLVVKLKNGYNLGLKHDSNMRVERAHFARPEDLKKEVGAELGKRKQLAKLSFDKKKPHISIVTTGGTIASRVDYKTGGVTGLMSPEEILNIVPELSSIVCVTDLVRPFTKMSENMLPSDWQKLAETVAKELNKNEGVVVTHGTDTLHFTSAALSFMLPGLSKPVVLTGAQRSSDRGSSDAAMNLICSAHVAKSNIAEVGICMHATISDDYCHFIRGTKVRKLHASRRDAFKAVNDVPLARVWNDGRLEVLNKDFKKRGEGKVVADTKFEDKVALVKAYPGADPGIIDYFVSKKYRGIVVEATGLGHVPTGESSWLPSIKKAIDTGTTVCFAPQTLFGRLHPFVYAEARKCHELGVIFLEDMLPETAYVKLGWVLGHTKKPEDTKKQMLANIAGEINPRLTKEMTLEPSTSD